MTTKYDELCKAYAKNLSDFKNYKEVCYKFAVALMNDLKQTFNIPDERLQLRSKDDPKETTENMLEAMDMQKDTFWHIRFSITVCDAEENLKESMSFEVCIKKLPNYFLLSIPNEREFTIDEQEEGYNFKPFFDYLFTSLKSFYEHELDRFLTSSATSTKKEQSPIGFRFDVLD